MLKIATFAVIALFWLAMNLLLLRSEFGYGSELASTLPVRVVWEKILTAPDDSALSLIVSGKRLGFIRWRPNVGEAAATGKIASENEPEGIVRRVAEYSLDIETSFVTEQFARAVRITTDIRFDPELKWKNFESRLMLRPTLWKLKGHARNRELWIEADEGDAEWIRRFSFDELKDPQKLLEQVESPIIAAMLAQNNLFQGPLQMGGFKWTARYDWLRIGRNRVRIYRLQGKLFGDLEMTLLVSRVGEILKAELPGNFKLINETLFTQ